ncbi:MAG TPA: YkvA family protein [Thermomicrobiales bacterium]|jgi:hypothetical protein|nr:YkvA family protein [Thermomicrobiales bacterium]
MWRHWPVIAAVTLAALVAFGLATAAARRHRWGSAQANATAWSRSAAADLVRLPGRLRAVAVDPRTPRRVRWLLVALALYIASPIDLIPDFIPVLGQLDDLIVIAIMLAAMRRMIPEEVWRDHFPPGDDGPP